MEAPSTRRGRSDHHVARHRAGPGPLARPQPAHRGRRRAHPQPGRPGPPGGRRRDRPAGRLRPRRRAVSSPPALPAPRREAGDGRPRAGRAGRPAGLRGLALRPWGPPQRQGLVQGGEAGHRAAYAPPRRHHGDTRLGPRPERLRPAALRRGHPVGTRPHRPREPPQGTPHPRSVRRVLRRRQSRRRRGQLRPDLPRLPRRRGRLARRTHPRRRRHLPHPAPPVATRRQRRAHAQCRLRCRRAALRAGRRARGRGLRPEPPRLRRP